MHLTRDPRRSPPHQLGIVVALAVLTAALWWGWFAWDSEYQVDPETGVASGPYEVWQGVGCAICAVVLVAAALQWLRPAVVILVMPPAFTLAFAGTAVPADETGLSGVGVVLVALGTVLGVALLVGLLEGARLAVGRRRSD